MPTILPPMAATTQEAVDACGSVGEASWGCTSALELTNSQFIARVVDIALKPARIALIFLIAWVLIRLMRRTIRRSIRHIDGGSIGRSIGKIKGRTPRLLVDSDQVPSVRHAQRVETVGRLVNSVGTVVIWALAFTMMLSELGINLGPLIAGAGIVGVALGFGAQNLVRDFLAGIFMLLEDQFGIGDVIDAGPASGQVEGISLRTTRVRDVEGVLWHIPNGVVQRIGNKSQQWSRAVLDIAVAYSTDVDKATRVIQETADALAAEERFADLILEPPEVWGIETLGPDRISIRLVVKTQPLEQWHIARELRARIKSAFQREGIRVPIEPRAIWPLDPDNPDLNV